MAKKNITGLATPWGFASPNKMANADVYYGTYDSLQDALDTVELAIREPGRTVGIKENDKVVEYWWESTTDLSDEALVKKTTIYPIFTKTESGLVPSPNTTTSTKFLREDGVWVIPTNTTYTAGTTAVLNTGTSATGQIWSAKVLTETFLPLNGTKEGKNATGTVKYTDILSFNSESTDTHIGLGQDFIEMSAVGESSSITQTINGLGLELTYETSTSSYSRMLEQEMTTEEFFSNTYSQTSSILNSGVSLNFRHFNNNTDSYRDLSVSKDGIQATENALPYLGTKPNDVVTVQNLSNYPLSTNWSNPSQRMSALPDKSADVTYNKFLLMNDLGDIAKAQSIGNALESGLNGVSTAQALRIAQLLNGGKGSAGTMSVNLISPPIIQNRYDTVEYVLLRGANLYLDNNNYAIEILNESKQNVVATIPQNQIQLYADGTQLIFYYNFHQFPEGKYFLRITSGVKVLTTTLDLKIVLNIENINLETIVWENTTSEGIVLSPNDIYNGRNLVVNTNNHGTWGVTNSYSFKSNELFEEGADFYIECDLTLNQSVGSTDANHHDTRIGIGYSDIINSLAPIPNIYMSIKKGNFNTISHGLQNSNYLTNVGVPVTINFIIIKTGNLFRLIQGNRQYSITLSNNSGYSMYLQTSKKLTTNTYTLSFLRAFKFN